MSWHKNGRECTFKNRIHRGILLSKAFLVKSNHIIILFFFCRRKKTNDQCQINVFSSLSVCCLFSGCRCNALCVIRTIKNIFLHFYFFCLVAEEDENELKKTAGNMWKAAAQPTHTANKWDGNKKAGTDD